MSEKTFQERCQDALPFVQAGAEGKPIQWYSTMEGRWYDVRPTSISNCRFRIKPDPQHRPFVAEEMLRHLGSHVRHKGNSLLRKEIQSVSGGGVWLTGHEFVSFSSLLEHWEFDCDSNTCGVQVGV